MDPVKKSGLLVIIAIIIYVLIATLVIGGIVGLAQANNKLPYGIMLGAGLAIISLIEYRRYREQKEFAHVLINNDTTRDIPIYRTRTRRTMPPIPPSRPNTPVNPSHLPKWVKPTFDVERVPTKWYTPWKKGRTYLVASGEYANHLKKT